MYVRGYPGGLGSFGVLPYGIEPPLAVGRYGTYPTVWISIADYERRRKAVEDWVVKVQRETGKFVQPEEWKPLLPVPYGTYINDNGTWYRAGDITTYAWEIMPPVIALGPPGTWQPSTPMSEAEAAAWIARVEASRQPGYGTPETLPERLGWTEPLTPEEIGAIEEYYGTDRPTEAPPPYIPPAAAPAPPPPILVPAPAAPPPAAPAPAYAPPPGYHPWEGTPALRARGWPPDVMGFWLTQAFGGDQALTEAFLLSFSGREELGAWVQPGGPHGAEDVMARARAALAARQQPTTTQPPGYYPPPGTQPPGGGLSLGVIALGAAAALFLSQK